MQNKDTRLIYNKIINLEVLVQTLLESLIEKEVIDQTEFEKQATENVNALQSELNKLRDQVSKNNEDSDGESTAENLKSMYWGKEGEA